LEMKGRRLAKSRGRAGRGCGGRGGPMPGGSQKPLTAPKKNHYAPILNPRPAKYKIGCIVQSLDTDGDGKISFCEVKVLISKLLDIPVEEIPDSHPEVMQFAGLTAGHHHFDPAEC
jgi:hypothetical protein